MIDLFGIKARQDCLSHFDIINRNLKVRPQGHWVDDNGADSYYANCSCCGYQIDTHYERGYLNFCPNCGADMRKDAENE